MNKFYKVVLLKWSTYVNKVYDAELQSWHEKAKVYDFFARDSILTLS